MPITFEVEDGTGSATATSYIATEEADDYFATLMHPPAGTSWSGLTSGAKEAACMDVSRYLDRVVKADFGGWIGAKVVAASGLEHPRAEMIDPFSGLLLAADVVYKFVKESCFEMLKAGLVTELSAGSSEGISEVKAGSVEVKFKDHVQSSGSSTTISAAVAIFEPYTNRPGGMGTLVRV